VNRIRPRLRLVAAFLCLSALVACGGSGSDDHRDAPALAPAEGEAFTDPQGSYLLTVPGDWTRIAPRDPETEGWTVAPKRNGFTPNVSIIAAGAPAATTVEQYMDLSFDELAALPGFELHERGVVVGAEGQELGLLSYSVTPGAAPISFMSYTALRSDSAVIATLTAPPASFDKIRREVEPYLLTLQAT
jgi:hypothetical protein